MKLLHQNKQFSKMSMNSEKVSLGVNYFLAILYSLILLIPIYYMVVSSFKSNVEIYNSPLGLPQNFTFEKYVGVQERVDILRTVLVSFQITIGAEFINFIFGYMAAYAISRIPSKLGKIAETIFTTGFLIPAFAILVPIYLLAIKVGLFNNPLSLMFFLSASRLPVTIIILSTHLRNIPRDIEESATIDGANRFQIMWEIMFPLINSGTITVLVINFISFWNEYLFGWILLSGNPEARTLQMAIPLLRTPQNVDFGMLSAAVVISLIPTLIIFMFFQDRIVTGMTAGAVKG